MPLIPVKTPKFLKRMFPKYIWDIPSKKKVLYLTFDDGPTPVITQWVLNTLNQYQAKATFFCIGNNIDKHPEIFKSVIANGHSIGNHTYNHLKGWKTKTNWYVSNTIKAQKTIDLNSLKNNTTQVTNQLFRPPYGKIKPLQGKKLRALGFNIVMWDVLSFDWDKNTKKQQCLNNVIKKAKTGSIIVFHDSEKAKKNMMFALPKVLEHFSKKGYSFKALN